MQQTGNDGDRARGGRDGSSAGDTYIVKGRDHEDGPYGVLELRKQAWYGKLRSDSVVRLADGSGNSFPASDVPGVFSDKDWPTALLLSLFLGVSESIAFTSVTRDWAF
jgi:hypothetical protein